METVKEHALLFNFLKMSSVWYMNVVNSKQVLYALYHNIIHCGFHYLRVINGIHLCTSELEQEHR